MRNRPKGSPFVATAGPGTLVCTPGSILPVSLSAQSLYARLPMQIEELRLLVVAENVLLSSITGGSPNAPAAPLNPAHYVKAQIFGGPFGLTAGYVPITVLSPRITDVTEMSIADGVKTGNVVTGSTNCTVLAQYRWKFDHPLPLGINESITANLTYFNPGAEGGAPWSTYTPNTPAQFTIYGSAVGRTIERLPKKCWVPYAAGYVGQNNIPYSQENDLRNMLNRPLTVRRMIGRALSYRYTGRLGGGKPAAQTGVWVEGPSPVYAAGVATASLIDQSQLAAFKLAWPDDDGSMQDYIGFADAFPEQTRCWDVNKVVPQGRSVSLQWGGNSAISVGGGVPFSSAPQSPNLLNTGFMPVIGMVGEREEVRL